MNHVQDMLKTHPVQSQMDTAALAACIEACFNCAQTCTICADACLGESMVQELVRCISLNLDCADVCGATGRMVSRRTAGEERLWRDQLQACITACEVCGAECERHASMHEHCRVCAEACHNCAEACRRLLDTIA
jgi:hypothetical protein